MPPLAAVFLGGMRRRRAATLLSVLAIAMGVALGLAVQVIHQAALEEFGRGMRSLSGEADLQIIGPGDGFDDAVYEAVLRDPLVADASAVVDLVVRQAGRDDAVRVLGVDVMRVPALQPALLPTAADTDDRFALFRDDALFPAPGLLEALGVAPGDRVTLLSGVDAVPLRVAGVARGLGAQRIAVMDIAAAQHHFAMAGRVSRIDLRLRAGVGRAAARAALAPLLPPGLALIAPDDARIQAGGLSRAYRVNLTMLAVIALVTGGFLVFSTQALSIARRHSEFAFLRAIGLERRALGRWVLAEGALLGVAGGLVGVALGHGFATVAFRWRGADLGAGYFSGLQAQWQFDPWLSSGFVLLGMLAGAFGAWLPARAASAVRPAAALKAGGEEGAIGGRGHPRGALLCLAGAVAVSALPPVDGIPVAGYGAIGLLLAGGVMALGPLAERLADRLPRHLPVPLRLARARLAAMPGHAVVAGAGVLASAALAIAMAVMVASFRDSVDAWLVHVLPADVYLRAARSSAGGRLDPRVQERVATLPGVAEVDFVRHVKLLLAPDRPPVELVARPVSADGRELVLVGPSRAVNEPVWISEAVADLWRLAPGDTLTLPLGGQAHRVSVAGVWRDYARQAGALVMPLDRYRVLSGDATVDEVAVRLRADGADAFAAALREQFGSALEARRPGEIRQLSLQVFDRTFAVTYLLEAAAVAIGLAGVAASFAAGAAARRREFGMLRHLGLSRRQIGAMIAAEGALTALVGTLGGILVGAAIAAVLIEVVNRQSFHWSMDYRVPWSSLAVFVLALVVLAAMAAVLAGRQAMREDAVRAVREDW